MLVGLYGKREISYDIYGTVHGGRANWAMKASLASEERGRGLFISHRLGRRETGPGPQYTLGEIAVGRRQFGDYSNQVELTLDKLG